MLKVECCRSIVRIHKPNITSGHNGPGFKNTTTKRAFGVVCYFLAVSGIKYATLHYCDNFLCKTPMSDFADVTSPTLAVFNTSVELLTLQETR
jgi:hypothetical protein